MEQSTDPRIAQALLDFAAGLAGTRETIRRAGFDDYADLLIAMAQNDLPFPKPDDTPERRANVARASAILQPLLRRDGP